MPHTRHCHHGAIPAYVEGKIVQAAVGSEDEPAQAMPAQRKLEKSPVRSCLSLCTVKDAGSSF